MTILLLIRHGENDYLKKGILIGSRISTHLNAHGLKQAEDLAKALKEYPIKAIYSSPLERAVETATPLANLIKMKIILCPMLQDTDVGDWTGQKVEELKKLTAWKQVQEKSSTFTFPGGESFVGIADRMSKALTTIVKDHKAKDMVAVFAHADPIKLAISYFLGLPLDNFQRLSVDTGSMSILILLKTSTQLAALNIKPPFPKFPN